MKLESLPNPHKIIAVLILGLLCLFGSVCLMRTHSQNEKHEQRLSQMPKHYELSAQAKLFHRSDELTILETSLPKFNMFVFEMRFDCSLCFLKLQEAYEFYLRNAKAYGIEFVVVTAEDSDGFLSFHLDKALGKYELWVLQQELTDTDFSLYFVNQHGEVLYAGQPSNHSRIAKELDE